MVSKMGKDRTKTHFLNSQRERSDLLKTGSSKVHLNALTMSSNEQKVQPTYSKLLAREYGDLGNEKSHDFQGFNNG